MRLLQLQGTHRFSFPGDSLAFYLTLLFFSESKTGNSTGALLLAGEESVPGRIVQATGAAVAVIGC